MSDSPQRQVTIVETLRGLEVRCGEVRVGTIAHMDASGTYAFRPDPNGPLAGTPVTRSYDAYTLLAVAEERLSEMDRPSVEPESAEPGLTEADADAIAREFRDRTARLAPPETPRHHPSCSWGGTADCAYCAGSGQCRYDEHGQGDGDVDGCEQCLGENVCSECEGDGVCAKYGVCSLPSA